MPKGTKIATCCYCGARTVLRLTARDGHELACGACGAPLHELKALKADPPARAKRGGPASETRTALRQDRPRPGRRRRKKRKPLWKKAMEEAFDLVEDIFD